MIASGGANGPIPLMTSELELTGSEGFWDKEVKFAKRWLTAKGVMVQEEHRNPVDVELESFFQNCRDGKKPKADVEVGLADSVAVILSNQAMDEGRKVYFNEIDKLFRALVKLEGSDLHLKVDKPPYIRTKGLLQPLNRPPVSNATRPLRSAVSVRLR